MQTDGTTISVGKSDAAMCVDVSGPDGARTLTGLAPGVAASDAATVVQVWTNNQQVLGQANAHTDRQSRHARKAPRRTGRGSDDGDVINSECSRRRKVSATAAAGTYGGVTALAVGANYWVSNSVLLNVHISRKLAMARERAHRLEPTSAFDTFLKRVFRV